LSVIQKPHNSEMPTRRHAKREEILRRSIHQLRFSQARAGFSTR
jgi:hypothetical protein